MCTNVDLTTPASARLEPVDIGGEHDRLKMVLRPVRRSCRCPDCGAWSESIHSPRKLSDLPASADASGCRLKRVVFAAAVAHAHDGYSRNASI